MRYADTAAHKALRERVAMRQLRAICPDAPTYRPVKPTTIVLQPVTISPQATWPDAGVWSEHLEGAGCSNGRQINILFAAQGANQPPTGVTTFPGDSIANWFLQRHAFKPAVDAVVRKTDLTGCRGVIVADTAVTDAPSSTTGRHDAPDRWTEQWTFRACEVFVAVEVTFSANASGGYDVSAK